MTLSAKLTVTCDRCLVEEEFPMDWNGRNQTWFIESRVIQQARGDGWRWTDEHVCPDCMYEEECCHYCNEHQHNCVCHLCGDCGEDVDDCVCHLCGDCGNYLEECICHLCDECSYLEEDYICEEE